MSKSSPMTISHRCLSVVPWISGNAQEGSDMFRMLGHPRGVRWTSCAMWVVRPLDSSTSTLDSYVRLTTNDDTARLAPCKQIAS